MTQITLVLVVSSFYSAFAWASIGTKIGDLEWPWTA